MVVVTRQDYGGVAEAEQEVVIRLDRVDQRAHITSTWPTKSRQIEKRHGPPRARAHRDGKILSASWVVPLAMVLLRRPVKADRVPSPAQKAVREAAAARFKRR